jgi:hypothetical protein
VLERDDSGLEARFGQQAQPCRAAEQTLDVPVERVGDLDGRLDRSG